MSSTPPAEPTSTDEADSAKAKRARREQALIDAAKWLVGGVTLAAAIAAFVGLDDVELGRVVRSYTVLFIVAVGLIVLSVAAGVVAPSFSRKRTQKWVFSGVACFLAGTILLISVHALATAQQERPAAKLTLTRTGDNLTAVVDLQVAGMSGDDYVFILLEGTNSQRKLSSESPTFATDATQVLADGRYWKHTLYAGRIGPGLDGKVVFHLEQPLASDLYERVVLQAVITNSADGKAEENALKQTARNSTFACTSEARDVGCARVLMPEAPDAGG